ncbi:LLM class flavin-dependent oxidoreductase [Candidatus Heimdallarchaeota archaeon]|nr:MAG: LLM class flavin-dependent oxidoreductase [Candidatus Heimdallarchaeota archaeon]
MTTDIKYGLGLIQFNEFSNPDIVVDFAVEAEKAGWDGIFLIDHIMFSREQISSITDTWILLAAIAARTEKIKIGTCVTALPRYHPWQFAKMTATLDVLSKGRLILGLGLGGPHVDYEAFGQKYDLKILAEKMDECLEIVQGLWRGEIYSFTGKHYQIDRACLLPKPVQKPRIPLILGGTWPNKKPFIRAAKFDGILPIHKNFPQDLSPLELKETIDIVKENRTLDEPFEVITFGSGFFAQGHHKDIVQSYANAGITWWLEHVNTLMQPSVDAMMEIVKQGPPKL